MFLFCVQDSKMEGESLSPMSQFLCNSDSLFKLIRKVYSQGFFFAKHNHLLPTFELSWFWGIFSNSEVCPKPPRREWSVNPNFPWLIISRQDFMQLQVFADGAVVKILQWTARTSSLQAGQNSIHNRVQPVALSPLSFPSCSLTTYTQCIFISYYL